MPPTLLAAVGYLNVLPPYSCTCVRLAIYQYASATLVYDPRLLSADPELKGFVKDRAADHPALKLQVNKNHAGGWVQNVASSTIYRALRFMAVKKFSQCHGDVFSRACFLQQAQAPCMLTIHSGAVVHFYLET